MATLKPDAGKDRGGTVAELLDATTKAGRVWIRVAEPCTQRGPYVQVRILPVPTPFKACSGPRPSNKTRAGASTRVQYHQLRVAEVLEIHGVAG